MRDSRNTGSLHRRDETADHGGRRNGRDDLRAGRCKRAEHTNVDTKRTKVRETANGVGRDSECAVGERVIASHDRMQVGVGSKLVLHELRGENLGHAKDLGARDTHEERHGVEDVAEDELEGKSVDAETTADPGKEAVDEGDEGEDCEHVAQDLAGDLDTEDGALREGVERVGGAVDGVEVTTVDNDAAASDGLVRLGVAHLGDGDRGGDGHHGCGDQVDGGDTEVDVCAQYGTGDGRETRGHDQVKLRGGHKVDVGANKASRLALADERRGGSDDGLGTGHIHGLEEEPSEVLQEPLHDTQVVKHLDESDEEDDRAERFDEVSTCRTCQSGRKRTVGEEPVLVDDVLAEEECDTGEGAVQEVGCSSSCPLEDRETSRSTKHEQGDNLLHEETDENGTPGTI